MTDQATKNNVDQFAEHLRSDSAYEDYGKTSSSTVGALVDFL